MQKVYMENIGGKKAKTTIHYVMNETIKFIDDL
jgi:hypothetical protein